MIKQRYGDLLNSPCTVIAHGCNCFCVMGAGIAKQIKSKFPKVYFEDLKTEKGVESKLGTFSYADYDGKRIYNLYTQFGFGPGRHVSYDAIKNALQAMKEHLKSENLYESAIIGFPKIGCGLGGGSWIEVKEVFNEVFDDKEVYVYDFEEPKVDVKTSFFDER